MLNVRHLHTIINISTAILEQIDLSVIFGQSYGVNGIHGLKNGEMT